MALLEMTNISKSFFGVPVLQNVDFTVEEGEVHALLGENGAGKSTLMNILAGVYTRDAGSVVFDGTKLTRTTISASEAVGIAFVHQELNLFNDLRVFENIFLRKEITTRLGVIDKTAMIKKSAELFNQLGVDIDPTMVVSELEAGKKQQLEIAKALFANAKLLILDEPTTALNNEEIDHLFETIRRLKKQGKSFIFISHKMMEIFSIADRYTVLRNGEFIASGTINASVSPRDIARLMVGNRYSDISVYETRQLGKDVIEADRLSGYNFKNVSFSVKKGEIVGFTGLLSAGISELFQTIFGGLPINDGKLTIKGKAIGKWNIHMAMKSGLAMIPSNRKENSLMPDASLLENQYVSEHTLSGRVQHIFRKKELSNYNELKDMLNIKANSATDLITSISGGNQQKVILARWLKTNSDILLMDNPTQGIDVGAKAEIYRLIHELARQGKTILVNSLEIPELQQVADRCFVFYHGQLQTELNRADLTEENVMLWATNAIHAAEVLSR